MFHSIIIAAECAHLLSGDAKYLELIRSQIKVLMDNSIIAPPGHTAKNVVGATERPCEGALIAPARFGDDGWEYYNWNPSPEKGQQETFRALEMCHLYHASGAVEDYELIDSIRISEAMFPPPVEGPPHRLPGINRFCAEAIHPMNHEKDQVTLSGREGSNTSPLFARSFCHTMLMILTDWVGLCVIRVAGQSSRASRTTKGSTRPGQRR